MINLAKNDTAHLSLGIGSVGRSGFAIEEGVLGYNFGRSFATQAEVPLVFDMAAPEHLSELIGVCSHKFLREMAFGLITSVVQSHHRGDWDMLGQAVVDWLSTLELEADRPTTRRMLRRRLAKNAGAGSQPI